MSCLNRVAMGPASSFPLGTQTSRALPGNCMLVMYYVMSWYVIPLNHTAYRDRTRGSLRGSSVKLGTMQRKLAWPLRKDDTHTSRSVNDSLVLTSFSCFFLFYLFSFSFL